MARINRKKINLTKWQQRRHTSLITFGVPLDELTLDMCATAALELEDHFAKIAEEARRNLDDNKSIRTGLLRKAIASKSLVINRRNSDARVWAGVGIDRKIFGADKHGRPIKPTKYAHLVEFGHGASRDKKSGKSIPAAPAKPFMRPAIAAVGGAEAIRNIAAEGLKKGALRNAS